MNINRFNSAYSTPNNTKFNKPKVAFGDNKGVIDIIEGLQSGKLQASSELGLNLQVELKSVDLNDAEFVAKIMKYPTKIQQGLVKYAEAARVPEIIKGLKKIFKF